jgi:hypothetical protein
VGERDDCPTREQPSADRQWPGHPAERSGAEQDVDADACDKSCFANWGRLHPYQRTALWPFAQSELVIDQSTALVGDGPIRT